MDPNQFVDDVRDENQTALSRLGSSKALYADTEGEMDTEPVLRAAADSEFHARKTFEEWAETEGNETARETYETTADEEGEHYGLVAERLDGDHEPGDTPAIHEYLRDTEDTAGRAGAFVGRTIATQKSKEQLVGFFVGQADTQGAQLFRDLGDEVDAQLERGKDLLSDVCETDDDWARAGEAAGDAIQAAYDEYTESLEEMGVNPKPVC
ncbi:MAG TPA: rubrerythrin family protein [Halococcus sp.]|nr:rubrerythrin family protein [Halococcus sp.]